MLAAAGSFDRTRLAFMHLAGILTQMRKLAAQYAKSGHQKCCTSLSTE